MGPNQGDLPLGKLPLDVSHTGYHIVGLPSYFRCSSPHKGPDLLTRIICAVHSNQSHASRSYFYRPYDREVSDPIGGGERASAPRSSHGLVSVRQTRWPHF